MKIQYVFDPDPTLASDRKRVIYPAHYLERWGHEVHAGRDPKPNMDIYYFSKHDDYLLPLIEQTKSLYPQTPIVYDMCDYHFEDELAPIYQKMVQLADIFTFNTPHLQKLVIPHLPPNKPHYIIPDLWEYPEYPPTPIPQPPLPRYSLVWFGFISNLPPLLDLIPLLVPKYDLTIITNKLELNAHLIKNYQSPHIHFTPWVQDVHEFGKLITPHHLVILPQVLTKKTHVKSPNRIFTALRHGKLAITSPLEAYQPLAPYTTIVPQNTTGAFLEAINHALTHPEETLNKIKLGQTHIREKYSPETISRQWENILKTQ